MNLKELAPKPAKRFNKVMESRFGFAIDYDNLSPVKAQKLSYALGEQLTKIRQSYGAHTAEQNSKYMEMLMVREGLDAWLAENFDGQVEPETQLMEGELETAEVVLAAKDMQDSVQAMVEDASKMLNEQLPPLLDTIRDQVGVEQGDQFKNTVAPALQTLLDNLNTARDTLDQASRMLAGEQTAEPMSLGGEEPAAELPAPDADADLSDLDSEDDGFATSDAAAGGEEEMGRERR